MNFYRTDHFAKMNIIVVVSLFIYNNLEFEDLLTHRKFGVI